MGIDVKIFYLGTPLDQYEYTQVPISIFPQMMIDQYNLLEHVNNVYMYLETRKTIYGLPQAGILANKQLRKKLKPSVYYLVAHTPDLWRNLTQLVHVLLVVDDFGVKYLGKENSNRILEAIKKADSIVALDWERSLQYRIILEWNFKEHWLNIPIP